MNQNGISSETLMLSLGYNAEAHQGAVKCPLFQTSTFSFRTANEGKAFFQLAYGLREKLPGEQLGMIYSRVNNPNMDLAEKRLAVWEDAEDAALFSSGMAAISSLVFTFLKPGGLLLYGAPVYGGTDHFFNHVLPAFNIQVLRFSSSDGFYDIVNKVNEQASGKLPGLIFTEIPGNPTNSLIDIQMCRQLAEYFSVGVERPILAVDNTFLGPVFQKPLRHGADISVYSATKFIGGHSDLLAGACLGNSRLIGQLKSMRTFLGSTLDSNSSWLILRSLETLKVRMEHQAKSARDVASFIKHHPMVKCIHYLGFLIDGQPDYELFRRQCSSPGSVFSFEIDGDEQMAFRFLDNLKHFKLAVSLGSTESLAEHPATMTHVDVSSEDRVAFGINERLIRLSIGLENPKDLIDDLKRAFEIAQKG